MCRFSWPAVSISTAAPEVAGRRGSLTIVCGATLNAHHAGLLAAWDQLRSARRSGSRAVDGNGKRLTTLALELLDANGRCLASIRRV